MAADHSRESSAGGWREAFIGAAALPANYLEQASRWFDPVATQLAAMHRNSAKPTLLVGINGAQGAGKTTLVAYICAWLVHEAGLTARSVSLDDVYLTRAERRRLAATVHPLLATRGVPGTHDVALLLRTLAGLMAPGSVAVPRFSKALDDRLPASRWSQVQAPVDIILLEGWCLGAGPQSPAALLAPCNLLESNDDPQGIWRRYVNQTLGGVYAELNARVDVWLMLQAPSFAEVLRWRTGQEQRLREQTTAGEAAAGVMDDAALAQFIQHYERLTRHCLATLPPAMDLVWALDSERMIRSWSGPLVPA